MSPGLWIRRGVGWQPFAKKQNVRSGSKRQRVSPAAKIATAESAQRVRPRASWWGAKLRSAFALVACAFVLYAGLDLYRRWDGSPVRVDLGSFLLSCGLAALAMLLQLFAFRSLVKSFTQAPPTLRVLGRLYMDSQLARYTPGKLGLVAVRISGASKVGMNAQQMGASLVVELLSWCAVGSLVSAGLLAFSSLGDLAASLGHLSFGVLALGSALALIALVAVPQRRWPSVVARLIGVESENPLLPLEVVGFHVLHFLAWSGCGVALAASVGAGSATWILCAGLVPGSIVLGFVAFLAPAGVGVREAVLLSGLSPVLGPSAALSVGLLARAASLLSDVFLWILFRWYSHRT